MRTYDYVIGMDGGGTKTDAALVDRSGHVLARAQGDASNPNDGGVAHSAAVVTELARRLAETAGVGLDACFLFGGIAGALNHKAALEAAISHDLPGTGVSIDSDMINLLTAGLGDGDGACVISGTGSACFLRCGGQVTRIGGWGYLLDSGGSGYDIGRQALEAVLRAHDGRGEATALTDRLAERLGAPVPDALTRLYAEGKTLIASLAPAVFEAAAAGDAVSDRILARNAAALGELIAAAYRRWTPGRPLPVVLDGGICRHGHPLWSERVAATLPSDVVAELTLATRPVLWGAVAEGMRRGGVGGYLSPASFEI